MFKRKWINGSVALKLFGVFLVIGLFIGVISIIGVLSSSVSALTYGSSTRLEYTFLPSLTVTFTPSTGFIIDNLNAGNSAYSNTVTVSVSSNASDGYILSATVGNTSDNNRNNNKLVHSNNTNAFDSIAANANLALNNLGNNKWGYATYDSTNENWSNYNGLATVGSAGTTLLSTNNADTKTLDMRIGASATLSQVSGTYTNNINFITTANIVTYNYTISFASNNTGTVTNMPTNVNNASFNTGGVVQISSTTPTADNGTFLGWCDGTVSGTTCTGTMYQPGDYIKLTNPSSSTTNAVALTGVWELYRLYMQDMTLSDCQVNVGTGGNVANVGDNITVYDKRSSNYASGDDGDYTIRWINGVCWMTQNLRVQGILSATDSNFTGSDFNVSEYDTKNDTVCNNNNGYTHACSHSPDSDDLNTIGNSATEKKVGVWYNYHAATAGTVSGTNNKNYSNNDVCPSGWSLPNGPANAYYDDPSQFYSLYQSSNDYGVSNNYLLAFSSYINNGIYYNQSLTTNNERWWSRRPSRSNGLNGDLSGDSRFVMGLTSTGYQAPTMSRNYSISIRCIKSS